MRIFEQTPVIELQNERTPSLRTPHGVVIAKKVVLATNAWAAGLKELRRAIIVLSSDMVATAPASERIAATGWSGGEAITDSRLMVHYHQVTHDGRIAIGRALLDEPLEIDHERASHRWTARSHLHTAGVATADRTGNVVSSLVSIFDEFGSGVFVREGGFVLNNRAEGFTEAPNDLRPGALPVHTLAPALRVDHDGRVSALATPGADGQVQTLLQVLLSMRFDRPDIVAALERPRWRGEHDDLLIERGHPAAEDLELRGHRLKVVDLGDPRFGGVVAAGIDEDGPWAAGDMRREVATGG